MYELKGGINYRVVIQGRFFYLATPKSLMCMGKEPLLVNIPRCQRLHFQATSERPLMTECFCPNCNQGELGGKHKVKGNAIVLRSLTLGTTFQTCTSMVSSLKQLSYNRYGQLKGLNLTFKLPLSSMRKFHQLTVKLNNL